MEQSAGTRLLTVPSLTSFRQELNSFYTDWDKLIISFLFDVCFQPAEVENFLGELASEVRSRLSQLKKKCKVITLKLKIREKSAPKETAKFLGKTVCCYQLLTAQCYVVV